MDGLDSRAAPEKKHGGGGGSGMNLVDWGPTLLSKTVREKRGARGGK